MSSNPFTDESRDARMKLSIDGVIDQLRAPESLHRLAMMHKPASTSLGDFALKSMLDAMLMSMILRGDYRGVMGLLVTLFGDEATCRHRRVTDVTAGDERHGRALARSAR